MKKQYFIVSIITCMLVIFNVKAQKTPIDNFLEKKYHSREGVTNVSMSQQMLKSIFETHNDKVSKRNKLYTHLNVPEAYSSVTISKENVPANLYSDFKKSLISSKYESFVEVNKENGNMGYYIKKIKNNTNEIVVLRQQKEEFSAIYIKGDIDINRVDEYLKVIKTKLTSMDSVNNDVIRSNRQFSLPSLDNFELPNVKDFAVKLDSLYLKFDRENLKILEKNVEKFRKDMLQEMKEAQKIFQERSKQNKETK